MRLSQIGALENSGARRAQLVLPGTVLPVAASHIRKAALLALLLAAACAPRPEQAAVPTEHIDAKEPNMEVERVVLPNLGPAPELQNEVWLNTDHPLRLAELRGSVVLLDMWTFG